MPFLSCIGSQKWYFFSMMYTVVTIILIIQSTLLFAENSKHSILNNFLILAGLAFVKLSGLHLQRMYEHSLPVLKYFLETLTKAVLAKTLFFPTPPMLLFQ